MLDEGQVAAPLTVALGFDPGPSPKLGCLQALLLQQAVMAWLFWRCGRWFAALLCLVPSAVAGALWLRFGKYWPMVALFWCDRAVLTDAGLRCSPAATTPTASDGTSWRRSVTAGGRWSVSCFATGACSRSVRARSV